VRSLPDGPPTRRGPQRGLSRPRWHSRRGHGPDEQNVPEWRHHNLLLDHEGKRFAKRNNAVTLQHMGLLPDKRPMSWYDPGKFWSGDEVELVEPFALGGEIAVVPG